MNDQCQKVLVLHVASLLERGRLPLVPLYLCHLTPGFRDLLCPELLAQLTQRLVAEAPGEAEARLQVGAAGAGASLWTPAFPIRG
jgi:hypothetical protein